MIGGCFFESTCTGFAGRARPEAVNGREIRSEGINKWARLGAVEWAR